MRLPSPFFLALPRNRLGLPRPGLRKRRKPASGSFDLIFAERLECSWLQIKVSPDWGRVGMEAVLPPDPGNLSRRFPPP